MALFRLVKSGESGLNLGLMDLFGRDIEVPNLLSILKTFFTREPIIIRIKGYPAKLINRVIKVQQYVDKKVEEEMRKAGAK